MSPGDLKSEYDAKGDFYFERTNRDRSSDFNDDPIFDTFLGDVSGKEILDLGCGDGFLSRMLHERGAVVTGVDLSTNLRDDGEFLFAMLHPCFETPFNDNNPPQETDAKGNFVAKRVNGYNVEGKWYSDGAGIRGTLGSIHRKLSTYVNELSAAGLLIKEMFEPVIPPGDYDDFAQQYQSNVPTFLSARCVKHRR